MEKIDNILQKLENGEISFDQLRSSEQKVIAHHLFQLYKGNYIDEIPEFVSNILSCNQCITNFLCRDDGETCTGRPNSVPDPERFHNAPSDFLNPDKLGRGMYIPLCGINGYEE